MDGMSAFCLLTRPRSTLTPVLSIQWKEEKEKKMNTQTETKTIANIAGTENPMQERHIGEVTESVEETAEAVLTAHRLEVREDAGSVFVP
jgi:hypothetical protein